MTETTTTTIPAGWKLVPIKPTHEMMQAAHKPVGNALYDNPFMDTSKGWGERGAEVYRAMLCAAPSPAPAAPSAAQPALEFGYTNWRGEYARRRVRPVRLYHGSTEWHPEPQWLMEAYDADKGGLRAFAVKDMVFGAQPAQDGSVSEAAAEIDEDDIAALMAWKYACMTRQTGPDRDTMTEWWDRLDDWEKCGFREAAVAAIAVIRSAGEEANG